MQAACAAGTAAPPLPTVSLEADGTRVHVAFDARTALSVSPAWLLDNNAAAPSSRDAASGQRLHDVRDLDLASADAAISAELVADCAAAVVLSPAAHFVASGRFGGRHAGGFLRVTFAAGGESFVSLGVLHDAALRSPRSLPAAPTLPVLLGEGVRAWASADELLADTGGVCFVGTASIAEPNASSSLRERAAALSERARVHRVLRERGLVFLRARNGESVTDVAALFGIVAETNYGRVFAVRVEDAPNNLAYTSEGLGFHTDNPYRDPSPGFQALRCLRAADEGGDTCFVDGFAVALALQAEDFTAFALLATVPVAFRFADASSQLSAARPLIEVRADTGELASLAYNNRSEAPHAGGVAASSAFYEATHAFARLLNDPRFVLRVRLKAGDAVVFDNSRLLHGRSSFKGPRHLAGCYITRDSVRSNAAVLERVKE